MESKMSLTVKIERTRDVKLPQKATDESACFDLYIPEDENITITPHSITDIDLGIKTEIPAGYHAKLFIRSGKGAQGLMLLNSVGIIDSDYRGNWKAWIVNCDNSVRILRGGERAFQFLIEKNNDIELEESTQLSETIRGDGAFGSTGK
jgi:dUTP pyrophosphatase